ncbi:MAG: carbohydrate ABC transporter permease [Suipraeoptans sp.]
MTYFIQRGEVDVKPSKKITPWLFSAPALLVYVFIVIVPIIWTIQLSLNSYNGIGIMEFVGLDNYTIMFKDPVFLETVKNSLFFMLVSTAVQIVIGLLLAIILSSIGKGSNFLRVIYFIPCIISSMAISQIFRKLLSVQPAGVLAALMKLIGMEPISLLSEPKLVLLVVALIDAYKFLGIYMIIFYSALKDIDESVVEAAAIDGCTWFKLQTKIKIPMIKNIIVMVTVLLVSGTLKGFDISYILTKGGPGTSSELVATYMYKTAFGATKYGLGSAMAVFLVVECLIAVFIVRKIGSRIERE